MIYDETRTFPLNRSVRLVGGDTIPAGTDLCPRSLSRYPWGTTVRCMTPDLREISVGLADFTPEVRSRLTNAYPTDEERA
jgi:hypothetical protein